MGLREAKLTRENPTPLFLFNTQKDFLKKNPKPHTPYAFFILLLFLIRRKHLQDFRTARPLPNSGEAKKEPQ